MERQDRIIRFLLVILLMLLIMKIAIRASAQEKPEEFRQIRVTYYTDYGITKDGSLTREGISAMNNYYLGSTAILYRLNDDGSIGELIGFWENKDIGGHKRLKEGKAIDLYFPTDKEGQAFLNEYGENVWIQILWDCVG